MADTVQTVDCGFFDSVGGDRLYGAEDMNRPYSRLVADGVFATPQGLASTDLQVFTDGSSLSVSVQKGQGIFSGKWFSNPSIIEFTVPANTSAYRRIDSVIVQVDERLAGRTGSVIYRTGAPASVPAPPDLTDETDVSEWRIANIEVSPSVSAISPSRITDLRGSSSCPWVRALIQQPDLSTMWDQYQAAYADQYASYTADYIRYTDAQRQAFEDFIETLTDQLTATMNVTVLKSEYVASGETSEIPINIQSYNPSSDALLVYINGVFASEQTQYSVVSDHIVLLNPISAGNTVLFVCFHALIAGDASSTVSAVEALDNKVDGFMSDSGWNSLVLYSCEAYDTDNTPSIRKIGGRVYLEGSIKGLTVANPSTQTNIQISDIVSAYVPRTQHNYTVPIMNNLHLKGTAVISVKKNGAISVTGTTTAITAFDQIDLSTCYLSEV